MTINDLEIHTKRNLPIEGVARFAGEEFVYNITFNYCRYGIGACRYDSVLIYGF